MSVEIKHFLLLLRELQNIDPEFPLQYAVCFAEISMDEGLSLTSLSRKTGMSLSTVSRIVSALSDKRKRGLAYGLVETQISPTERRQKQIYLSTRGQDMIKTLELIITPLRETDFKSAASTDSATGPYQRK